MKDLFYWFSVILFIFYCIFIFDLRDDEINTLHELKKYNGSIVVDIYERNIFFPYSIELYKDGDDKIYKVSQYVYEYHITLGDTIDIE